MKDAVIVPVYNEAATLKPVLDKIRQYHSGEIVTIDDGSVDRSPEILDSYEGVTVIRHDENRGYGATLISGFSYVVKNRFDRVVTIDCDEQHEPALIPQMFDRLKEGVDVLSGSRYLSTGDSEDTAPADRRRVNVMVTKLINDLLELSLTDAFCGFKSYRVEALEKLDLDEPGYGMPLQFWVQAKHFGLTVRETKAPRIYKNVKRSFGGPLDDAELRLFYYRRVIEKECKRWSICSSSEPIQMI